jgi:hypothetical protein
MDPLQEKLTKILIAADWDSDEDETFFAEIENIREETITEFTFEKLRSYYLDHPDIYIPVGRRLDAAKHLETINAAASLIFSLSASEVCLKNLILRPMVYGFVHQTYIAQVIADLAVSHMGWDRFRDLLESILRDKLGIDLGKAHISGTSQSLWEEFNRLVKIRNGILHRAEDTTAQEEITGLGIANELACNIFPSLLENFALKIDESRVLIRTDS